MLVALMLAVFTDPTFVYVYQVPCPPCKAAKAVLETLKKDGSLKGLKVAEYDFKLNKDYLTRLKVTRTPSFLMLDDKGKVLGILNDNREAEVRAFIKKHNGQP